MIQHSDLSDEELRFKLKNKEILFGGNKRAKIYGTLTCTSGKRLNREDRVFFDSEDEALEVNFRPCGQCMRNEYKKWRDGSI